LKKVKSFNSISLGTVQWGMPYGIANKTGQPSLEEVLKILRLASENGIDTLDTARSYGSSESIIGDVTSQKNFDFRIITKLSPDIYKNNMPDEEILVNAQASISESMNCLKVDTLDTVLLHRGFHRSVNNGVIWKLLRSLKESGLIRKIGISAVNPTEALEALDDSSVDVIQVASSLMDRRLISSNFFEDAAYREIEVHIRSVFLQGIAHLNISEIPKNLGALTPEILKIRNASNRMEVEPIDLWINHALGLKASRIILGVDNENQLINNIGKIKNLIDRPLNYDYAELADLPDQFLDPSMWVHE
jgi:aryl-alcohol dehydrogenase-like predicted oxidoreductase